MKYNLINLNFPINKQYLPENNLDTLVLKSKKSNGYWILSTEDTDTSIGYTMFFNGTYGEYSSNSNISPYISTVIEISEDKFNSILQKELIIRSLEA